MSFRQEVLAGKRQLGVGAMLGNSMIVEMIGAVGFDWAWLDLEHGIGGKTELFHQIQAAAIHATPAVVRMPGHDPQHVREALDMGASGIMFPHVRDANEARAAVAAMRYPPRGVRGAAQSTRAAMFGLDFEGYVARASTQLLCVVQIESQVGADNARSIAAVDGVDVLFVGPIDLSVDLNQPKAFSSDAFNAALEKVREGCSLEGKVAGILAPTHELALDWQKRGFSFMVVGADGGILANAFKALHQRWNAA
jgi:4-hydroxy-2-oxoheptanedioate aldolase